MLLAGVELPGEVQDRAEQLGVLGAEQDRAQPAVGVARDRPVVPVLRDVEVVPDPGDDVGRHIGLDVAVTARVQAQRVVVGAAELVGEDDDRGDARVVRRVGVEDIGQHRRVGVAGLAHHHDDDRQPRGVGDERGGRKVDAGRPGAETRDGRGDPHVAGRPGARHAVRGSPGGRVDASRIAARGQGDRRRLVVTDEGAEGLVDAVDLVDAERRPGHEDRNGQDGAAAAPPGGPVQVRRGDADGGAAADDDGPPGPRDRAATQIEALLDHDEDQCAEHGCVEGDDADGGRPAAPAPDEQPREDEGAERRRGYELRGVDDASGGEPAQCRGEPVPERVHEPLPPAAPAARRERITRESTVRQSTRSVLLR